jgi:hypothetical protein
MAQRANIAGKIPTPHVVVLTSDGTFTKPAGVSLIEIELWGGGGGYVGVNGFGGGGGYAKKLYTITGDVTYTIGAGGAPNANGGNTVFDSITASGGKKGGGGGGIGTGGDINLLGGSGNITSQLGGLSFQGSPDGASSNGVFAGDGAGINGTGANGKIIIRWLT